MFRNRSVRLLLLATAMIPATATFGAFKIQGQIGQVAVQAQPAPAPAAGCIKCSDIKTNVAEIGTGDDKSRAENQLKGHCENFGCDPDFSTLGPGQTVVSSGGLRDTVKYHTVEYYAGKEVVKKSDGLGGEVIIGRYARCKDKPKAAPAPVKPMPEPVKPMPEPVKPMP